MNHIKEIYILSKMFLSKISEWVILSPMRNSAQKGLPVRQRPGLEFTSLTPFMRMCALEKWAVLRSILFFSSYYIKVRVWCCSCASPLMFTFITEQDKKKKKKEKKEHDCGGIWPK